MKTLLKTAACLLLAIVGANSLTACHTVKGAGKDIEKAGEEIQKASDKAREH